MTRTRSRRLHVVPWAALAFALGLLLSPPALAAESVTIEPPADAIEGNSFPLTVSSTTDSSSTTDVAVYIRRDDGTACQPSAAAVSAATPKAAELFFGHRQPAPMLLDVPAQSFVGGLRVCAFVQLVAAPQTTLSAHQVVIPIRAPTATLALQSPTTPLVGQPFTVRVRGSSEAANGNLFVRAQRGPCAPLSATDIDNLGGGSPITEGGYDATLDAAIEASTRRLPDRVCGWLYSDGGVLLARASQTLHPRFDGSLVVTKKRLLTARQHGHLRWFLYLESHTIGNVVVIRFTRVSGDRCVSTAVRRKGRSFKLICRLAVRPRAPLVFQLSYSTGLGASRSTGHLSIAPPRRRSSDAWR